MLSWPEVSAMIAKTNLTAVGFFAQRGALFGALVNSRRGVFEG
jgi:hypothetical protein